LLPLAAAADTLTLRRQLLPMLPLMLRRCAADAADAAAAYA